MVVFITLLGILCFQGVSSLPPVRETIPEHPEIYSSSPSLRGYDVKILYFFASWIVI